MARKKKTVRRKTSSRKRPARSRTAGVTARRRPRRSSTGSAPSSSKRSGGSAGFSLAELQAELTSRVSALKSRRAELEAELAEIDAELAEVDGSLAAAVPTGASGNRRRGRPPGSGASRGTSGGSRGASGSRNGRRRGGRTKGAGGKNLAESLYEVLKGKEMKVSELVDAVQAAGYQSKSPNFRVMVSAALSKNKGTMFKNVKRGVYTTVD